MESIALSIPQGGCYGRLSALHSSAILRDTVFSHSGVANVFSFIFKVKVDKPMPIYSQLLMDAFFGKGLVEKRDPWNRARVHKGRLGSWTRPKSKLTKHRKQIRKQKRASAIIQKRVA